MLTPKRRTLILFNGGGVGTVPNEIRVPDRGTVPQPDEPTADNTSESSQIDVALVIGALALFAETEAVILPLTTQQNANAANLAANAAALADLEN